ncbi:MAG: M3 family metallopeptidase [Gammaproteobacteria bacterium]|nr:M3 family metallopeptidase [Gammaproteobacteria bacterium]
MASIVGGCSDETAPDSLIETETEMTEPAIELPQDNPFAQPSTLELEYPRFDLIEDSHYLPAFEVGMREQLKEIETIATSSGAPTVENTLVPLERSGQLLDRVSSVFFGLVSTHTNDTMNEIRAEIAPQLAAHYDQIMLNAQLFERIQSIYAARETLGLDPETLRLTEETHREFVRAGAELASADKERLRAINTELAELRTEFDQNVLDEVNALAIVVDTREELAGLTEAEIETAADAAESRGIEGKFVIPLLNTTQQPLMSALENRDLRERMLRTSMSRGSNGSEFDNRELVTRIARLRAEHAQLLGYATHADYSLDDQMAGTVAAVNERLASLTPPAVRNARREAADLQALIDAEGGGFELAAWDWDFYAEKVRRERYAFDDAELRPYFELDRVLEDGAFYAAGQIYGIRFVERFDLPVYEDSVRVFEVFDHDDSTLALFLFDPYARDNKRGGAWARSYVRQSRLLDTKTVSANHLNVTRPPEGEPTLLTFSEVTTLFHEFGHALHAMFSDVNYPSLSGTSVPRDFVEYPSQVNEMWGTWPEVLANYAQHYETGEPMPQDLLDRVLEAENFNQGYATAEYLAASIIDQALHQLGPDEVPSADELMDFQAAALEAAGADLDVVPPRYRFPYFSHVMGGYSAGYYAYVWSEVLDADTVRWFEENGGMRRENGQRLRDTLLSKGGSVDAMTLYRDFRGRDPAVQPLLERRGLD